jgi:cytochrome c oxidase subunit IV
MANEKKKPEPEHEHDEEAAAEEHPKAEAKSQGAQTAHAKSEGHAKTEAKAGHNGHAGHGGAAGHAHAHKPNIREYMVIFAALAVLTVVEVAVTRPELHVPHGPMTLALIGLALTKAAIVALYYMHLKHETRVLKLTVALPMAAPTIYALVLISEAAWRLTR